MIGAFARLSICAAALVALAACQDIDRDPQPRERLPILALNMPIETGQQREFTVAGELTQGGWIRGQAPDGAISVRIGDEEVPLRPDGGFFAGIDRDAGDEILLKAKLEDGGEILQKLSVAPRDWPIEHVNVARRTGGSSEAFRKRRAPELEAIYLARKKLTESGGWQQDFVWPVQGRISGRFGSQRIYRGEPGSYHSGMDISTGKGGTPFVAPAAGVVVLAVQNFSLEGNLLIIDHGQGLNSAFLHASRLLVKEGDEVRQGQQIGNIGSSGRATGPHLHWSIKWNDARLDPLLFVPPQG
jgi:hypothetical protein